MKNIIITSLLCLIVGFTANLQAQQIVGGSTGTLSYDTSYQAGQDAGAAAATAGSAYDDTVPFICDACYDPTAYKAGYKAGYENQRTKTTKPGTPAYLSYDSSYQMGNMAGASAVCEGKAYDDTPGFWCDAGGQPEPTAYKAGYKAGYDEQKTAMKSLAPDTSYQMGLAAGKTAGLANAAYDDTPGSSAAGVPAETASYKKGYHDGYASGALDALNKRQSGASDPWGYSAGYIAGGTHAGYNPTPPDQYYANATADQKTNYSNSYHTGYFDAIDDLVQFKTGKATSLGKNAKGDQMYKLNNGTVFCVLTNGWIYIRNGKVAISLAPDGTAIGGVVISDDGKGNYTWQGYDGSKTYTYSDGSYYYVGADSKYWEYYNAGASTRVLWDGSWEYNSPDGTTYIYSDPNGKITTYINGVKQ